MDGLEAAPANLSPDGDGVTGDYLEGLGEARGPLLDGVAQRVVGRERLVRQLDVGDRAGVVGEMPLHDGLSLIAMAIRTDDRVSHHAEGNRADERAGAVALGHRSNWGIGLFLSPDPVLYVFTERTTSSDQ